MSDHERSPADNKIHIDIAESVRNLTTTSGIPFSDQVQGLLLGQLHNLEVAIEDNTKAAEEAARKADLYAKVLFAVGAMTLFVAFFQVVLMAIDLGTTP